MNGDNQPAVRISWKEAMEYCQWLSEKTGMKFTLPTEAQWEWACRSGSNTAFWFGDLKSDFSSYANLGDIKLKEFAACTAYKFYESAEIIQNPNKYDDWIPRDTTYNDGGFISESVGRYIRSPWDLFDMHGNVWEWTRSVYQPYPYQENDGRNDPQAGKGKRVVRGGSWYDRPYRATSSFRLPYRDYQKVYNVSIEGTNTELLISDFLRNVNTTAVGNGILPNPLTGAVGVISGNQIYSIDKALQSSKGNILVSAYAVQNTDVLGPLRLNIILRQEGDGNE